MTTVNRDYIFSGTASWVKSTPTTFKDGTSKYTMSFFPDSVATRKAIEATGAKNKIKLDDETGMPFYTFRSEEAYKIIDDQGQDITALIGNGSEVKIKLNVEAFTSPKYGPTARTKLLEVMVTKLVPYEKPEASGQSETASAPQADLPA